MWVYGVFMFKDDFVAGKAPLLAMAAALLAGAALPFVPAVWSLVAALGWPGVKDFNCLLSVISRTRHHCGSSMSGLG
jgi:hypothetical protein